MKSFSAYTSKPLSEGYNIFPKNEKELSSAIKDRSPEIQKEIKSVLLILIFFGQKKINHISNIFLVIIKIFLTVKCCYLKI